MKNNFKKFDKIVSISNEGELEIYKIYSINDIHKYGVNNNEDINFTLDGLLWTYHKKNFISMNEYRVLKLYKIDKKYERR